MKKTLLAVAIGALAVASTANANWYVEGDVGVSKTKFTSYSNLDKTKFEPRIAVGYKLGNFRVAGDYTYHGKFNATETVSTWLGDIQEQITAKVHGFGLSGYYDFDLNSALKPYVGVRLAANQFKIENSGPNFFDSSSETKFGYGVSAGASYQFAPNVAFTGGLEYNRLGSYEDTKVNNYGAKVGVRYEF